MTEKPDLQRFRSVNTSCNQKKEFFLTNNREGKTTYTLWKQFVFILPLNSNYYSLIHFRITMKPLKS